MLKYESVANIGDTIKAFDFEPMPGRDDVYLVGKVVDKGMVKHPEHGFDMYKAYTVEVTGSDAWSKRKVGEIMYVPFESTFDYEGRVTKVDTSDEDLAKIGAHIIARATKRAAKSKKEAAMKLFKDFGHNGRKYVIDMFIRELGMTKAGANTYYYNCKKGA